MTAEPGTEASRRSDARVIERSQDEPEAFAELFDRHSAAVHRYVARRLGTQAADDLMADTFAAAFQQRHRYDTGRADARPWLFGIATNLVGRHRRAEARRFRALSRLPAPVGHGQGVAELATARADAFLVGHRLAAALAALPARHRDVLLLIAWAELSYEETARALAVPVGTVRSRLSRARGTLREALGGSDPTVLREAPDHA
ncbi:RNA polymerase sigma factor [Streptomyces atacamensis]|uniref:RNA polymerase sigma factor n=1 Tax=Streptomyces atacamensis TaxID=531966 RepID=UPI00399C71A0